MNGIRARTKDLIRHGGLPVSRRPPRIRDATRLVLLRIGRLLVLRIVWRPRRMNGIRAWTKNLIRDGWLSVARRPPRVRDATRLVLLRTGRLMVRRIGWQMVPNVGRLMPRIRDG